MDRITPDTLIKDVLAFKDGAADVFDRHGLACPSCLAAGMESIREVAVMHDVAVGSLLEDLSALPESASEEE
ncbi:MAG: DUF1858 domain-containing protein [Coriobacteriia bacterium]|nr:DUF1858 domain-containing protein [Coriobacteriia bacterium]